MKSKFIVFLLSVFLSASLAAQDWEKAIEPSPGFASVNEAARMAKQIVDAAGTKANFRIAEARVPNAMAVVHGGQRYILYNPRFISLLTVATGTKWSAISVLAHEIGHHLYSSSVNKGRIPMATELEADEFSGYVLRKLGATEAEAAIAIRLLGSEKASRTHPGRDDRVNSIAKGWRKADGSYEANTATIAKTDAPVIQSPVDGLAGDNAQTGLPKKNILAAIRFNADPENEYYVTSSLNVVKVHNDKLYVIGKLARSNSRNYPFIIYDEEDTRVYVKPTGDIISSNGSTLGRMRVYGS